MKKFVVWLAIPLTAMVIACSGGGSDDTGEATTGSTAGVKDSSGGGGTPSGVYKFGSTVKFKDDSTLTVGKPVKFSRDQYAIGGENAKIYYKFKATFKNNTQKIFDPALTTGSATAAGVEAESVFQSGLDAPDNKVLPGKSVTWWMGYGFASSKELQLEMNVGFLDYGTVIFTG